MSLPAFIESLLAEGQAAVPEPAEISADDRARAAKLLGQFEREWQLNLPGPPPSFVPAAATWAAVRFYEACQYSVFRDEGPQFTFEPAGPREFNANADAHYSVDLLYRFLPDLVRLVRAAASADPLLDELLNWGRQWPLSSVGVADLQLSGDAAPLAPILASPTLTRMYADRIVERRDTSRLNYDAARQAVSAALGLHSHLAPEVAAAVKTPQEQNA